MSKCSLAELCIVACAEAFRHDGEMLASGIGPIPMIAVGLAKSTCNKDLLMTDGKNMLLDKPLPMGNTDESLARYEGKMPFADIFDLIYAGGKRHAMVSPVQMDRYGQTNISLIGSYDKPKISLLGVRGFPGNTMYHANSFFVQSHTKRAFVADMVDMVSGVGYLKDLWPGGKKPDFLDLRRVITNLAVMDFAGKENCLRLVSLHAGVSLDHVESNTGFPFDIPSNIPTTPMPTDEQLAIVAHLDPKGVRSRIFPDDPKISTS